MTETLFRNRADAGRKLREALGRAKTRPDLIIAIVRGGIAVAEPLAREWGVPVLPACSTRVRHPLAAEVALGVIDAEGEFQVGAASGFHKIPAEALESAIATAAAANEEKKRVFAAVTPEVDVVGKTVLLVDDGLLSGESARAALMQLARRKPARLVLGLPIADARALESVRPLADECLCLEVAPGLESLAPVYQSFEPVESLDAIALLRSMNAKFLVAAPESG